MKKLQIFDSQWKKSGLETNDEFIFGNKRQSLKKKRKKKQQQSPRDCVLLQCCAYKSGRGAADNNISEKERGTTSYVDKIARNKYLKNGDSN